MAPRTCNLRWGAPAKVWRPKITFRNWVDSDVVGLYFRDQDCRQYGVKPTNACENEVLAEATKTQESTLPCPLGSGDQPVDGNHSGHNADAKAVGAALCTPSPVIPQKPTLILPYLKEEAAGQTDLIAVRGSASPQKRQGHVMEVTVVEEVEVDEAPTIAPPPARLNPAFQVHMESGSLYSSGWFAASMQGWRDSMEDAYVVRPLPRGTFGGEDCAVLAVFDGHGGDQVARLGSELLPGAMEASGRRLGTQLQPPCMARVLLDALPALDRQLRSLGATSTGNRFSTCGSTVCAAAVNFARRQVYCGNLGDSRMMIVSANKAGAPAFWMMSDDHRPDLPEEANRIHSAGGCVLQHGSTYRLHGSMGSLAMSRCLGDFSFKADYRLPPQHQQVIAVPDVRMMQLCPTQDYVMCISATACTNA